jgi:hypothetical protein
MIGGILMNIEQILRNQEHFDKMVRLAMFMEKSDRVRLGNVIFWTSGDGKDVYLCHSLPTPQWNKKQISDDLTNYLNKFDEMYKEMLT